MKNLGRFRLTRSCKGISRSTDTGGGGVKIPLPALLPYAQNRARIWQDILQSNWSFFIFHWSFFIPEQAGEGSANVATGLPSHG